MNSETIKKQEYQYMVCVRCISYNHERYIRECLEGFVMQHTNFKFIVVIVDDASTDQTPSIISEYAAKFPTIIHPILLKENHYSRNKSKEPYLFPFIKRSKYVAYCEGDDYWKSPNKLQSQFDALEEHPDCRACVHTVEKINEKGIGLSKYYPQSFGRSGIVPSKQIVRMYCEDYPFQTSSFFINAKDYLDYWGADLAFRNASSRVGDVPLMLYMGQLGDVYYLSEIMSCYRVASNGSHNERTLASAELRESVFASLDRMIIEYDKYTNGKYHKYCQLFLQRNMYKRLEIAHFTGKITKKEYERTVIKKQYRYFFRRNTPFKSRLLTYLNVYLPYVGELVIKHFTHIK